MNLARRCGINVCDWKILKFNSDHHTFITKRFDRLNYRERLHFTSAMTMLGYTDGADASIGVSYLEIAEWIMQNCCNVKENLLELFRRIAFNIAVSNCDDHLRNHGFLFTTKGWTLSPAYDLTPDEHGTDLKLCINEKDSTLDFNLVLSIAPYLGIQNEDAKSIIEKIKTETSRWREVASSYNIPHSEQDLMQTAFEKR